MGLYWDTLTETFGENAFMSFFFLIFFIHVSQDVSPMPPCLFSLKSYQNLLVTKAMVLMDAAVLLPY